MGFPLYSSATPLGDASGKARSKVLRGDLDLLRFESMELKGKKVIVLGERDGVQGPAIAKCVRDAGAEVVLEATHCFV